MKYVKKPIAIEAIQLPNSGRHREFEDWYADTPDWFKQAMFELKVMFDPINNAGLYIKTLEGEMLCKWGNYLICSIKGELYPCRRDIFEETYEQYEEE